MKEKKRKWMDPQRGHLLAVRPVFPLPCACVRSNNKFVHVHVQLYCPSPGLALHLQAGPCGRSRAVVSGTF
jgi:hypothetical protein